MVELPQELVPNETAISEVPPLDISSLPPLTVTLSGTATIQTAELPPEGLKRFYGPAHPLATGSPAADVLYAVPSPAVLSVLKQVVICNTSSGNSWFTLGINGTSPAHCLLHEYPITGNSSTVLNFEIPLEPGDTLNGFEQGSNEITVTLIGTETPL